MSAAQKGDWLYAGTTAGLFTMNTKTEEEFSKIPGFREVWDIQLINDEIIVAASSGVHKLWNNRIIVTIDVDARAILMTDYPGIIWVGLVDGVGRIDVSGEKWQWEGKIPGISHDVRTMVFESDSILWASFEQVSKLTFSAPRDTNPEIITFGETHGINENFFVIESSIIQEKVVFGTGDGIYCYDPDIQKFIAETTFGAEFINKSAWALTEDPDQNIWITSDDYNAIISHLPDGSYSIDSISLVPLFKTDIWKIIPQDKDKVWLCTTVGLYRYDKSQPKVEGRAFQALITRVEIYRDSIVTYLEAGKSLQDFKYITDKFTRSQNDIRFRFTAPSYYKDEVLKYSFKLEGYDKDWSVRTEENQKEYTNLPANNYKFRVRATNHYGFISEEAIYSFRVLPAWWETWLARICYILLSMLMIYLMIRWRTANLTRKQKRLEYKIQLATKEIRKQKEEVEDQKEEIESQRDEIEVQRDEVEAQRDQLELQHDVVVSQKNEIIESINYAQRIQSAMLPPATYFSELLHESFILYKPRDIVSGDFYWIKQVNQYIVLVAADCTGHGVPGAFMSMLGISYLNEIVQRREITQANQILNELRKQIKYSLRQQGLPDESKDGIDMALCVMDLKSMKMQYAGANSPLYLINDVDGTPELKEIKADRMPLGYYQTKDVSFVNHDIQLEMGDTFYMFSDGFIDQQGGKEGKKFLSKNFKNLLLENQDRNMHDQKEILEKTLSDWMGDISQIDDVLVIGVRV
jgi:serine phosphatase RsbU (regulator of sigma subunit)